MTAGSLRLPQDAVLLHIGAFKTGTTAIQGALFRARPQLSEHGVVHAGEGRQPMDAVLGLTGKRPPGRKAPRAEAWDRLVTQVAAAADKFVIVSSEFFGAADEQTASRAVRELGGPRVHVVVTLRPLAKIMPSQWQQYVRNRSAFSYDDWLEGMLKKAPYDLPTPSFWERHSHDVLVERWASIVGPENVTVVVPPEGDRSSLLRTFEELSGLPSGLLAATRDTENRSMTMAEIELVRQVNVEFGRRKWPDEFYRKVVRQGLSVQMQTSREPSDDEPPVTTPQWALDRVAEIGAEAAVTIRALGVRIVGDISSLGNRSLAEDPQLSPPEKLVLPVEAARDAVVGIITASGMLTPPPSVASTSTRRLARILLGRVRRRLRRKVGPPAQPAADDEG